MKIRDIQTGRIYHAKVSGYVVPVKVLGLQISKGRYGRRRTEVAIKNLLTNRLLTVSPARLRPLPFNHVFEFGKVKTIKT